MDKVAADKVLRGSATTNDVAMRWAPLLRRIVGRFEYGSLAIDLPSGERLVLAGKQHGHYAHVRVRQWRAVMRLALSGDVGFAESLVGGECASDDLKTFLLWALQNIDPANAFGGGFWLSRLLLRIRHGVRANTRRNSRRNIAAHYDLGNDFYAAWLDPDMNYSSGIYRSEGVTLAQSQRAKIERIADLLEMRGGERVLEIGCGWGALAKHLIEHHGCHVTGLTLSERQQRHALGRLYGLEGDADIRLQDYRDVEGTFDRIASIEMLEAVGEAYWPVYFNKLASLLVRDGVAVLQVITIDECRYEAYRARPDFIQLNIFPGGMLLTKTIIAEQATRAGFELTRSEHFGQSYARTLADWRQRFHAAWPEIAKLGFDERFRRLWDYYLVYCEAGFEAGWLDVGLYQLRHAK
jgi:cyclopropane-fatty-acyl-phospholipid synthase